MRIIGIYRIVHVATGREYIGQSADMRRRWRKHLHMLENGTHHCPHLLSAWRKYGANAFSFEILEICDRPNLTEAEQRLFIERSPVFNAAPAAGSTLGVKQTEAATNKKRGRKASVETRERMSAARKGKTISPEQRAKIAATLRGRKRPPEVVEKVRVALAGRRLPDITRQRMSEGQKRRRRILRGEENVTAN